MLNKEDQHYTTSQIRAYEYWAQVKKVVDGDTLDLLVSVGFDILTSVRVRLLGVNTPEVWGVKHSSEEYKQGKKVSEYVKSLLPEDKWVEVKIFKGQEKGKYGRWLSEVFVDGKSLNEDLINQGYGAEY